MVNVPWCQDCNNPEGLCRCVLRPAGEQTIPERVVDFAVSVYKGCVLPEDYRPVRTIAWSKWVEANPDEYSAEQLELIKSRLQGGKSWVCFMKVLETISAPDYYKPIPFQDSHINPVRPKDRLL